jgi:RNA polymerase sigma-70 factor (ECF subfamily)
MSNPRKPRQGRFEALAEKYSSGLYRYALWLSGDKVLAEDVVQETFMRAWRSFDSLKREHAAKRWLFTILRREHARVYERQRPEIGELDAEAVADGQRYDTSAEAFVLRRALATLAPEYREPLVLQVLGGFTCDEIASLLDLSPAAVMTRVFRARKQLREMLTEDSLAASGTVMA